MRRSERGDCTAAVVGHTASTGEARGAADAAVGAIAAAVATYGGGFEPHSVLYSFLTQSVNAASSDASMWSIHSR